MPSEIDFAIWRGNNAPDIVWTLPDEAPEGATYFLTIAQGDEVILAHDTVSGSLLLDAEAGTLTWSPTIAQSRSIPRGRVAQYEIEQRLAGIERTIIFGAVTGLGGINADAGSPFGPTMLDASDPMNSSLLFSGWLA